MNPHIDSAALSVTVLIAVKNEAVNLERCLAALGPAARVVVLDSHSTDRTAAIAGAWGAEVVQFDYAGGYPKKRQWALDTVRLTSEWVLLLDADEVVPDKLWKEITAEIRAGDAPDAFLITKGFHFLGRRFRFGGFSHSAVLLFRRGAARFEHLLDDPVGAQDMEVHERLVVEGRVGRLRTPLIHEDFKGLQAYIDRHNHYSTWEARLRSRYLRDGSYGRSTIQPRLFGNAQERRRFLKFIAVRTPGEPLWWFLYHYVFRLGWLEGRPGLIAAQIRASYIAQARAKCFELGLEARRSDSPMACASKNTTRRIVPKAAEPSSTLSP
jgi:glycosyltransferase involved in cell wall biosynthesis